MSLLSFSIRMGIVIALCALPLGAQNIYMAATIPFDFEMANVSLPAGQYQVVREMPGQTVMVRSVDRQHLAIALVGLNDTVSAGNVAEFKLVFHRYGNGPQARSFLRKVSCGATKVDLLQSHSERDAEAAIQVANARPTEVVIVAKRLR